MLGETIAGALTGQHHSQLAPKPTPPTTLIESSAIPVNLSHESGWILSIILDKEGREEGIPWRTNEGLRGSIIVEPREDLVLPPRRIKSLIVKAFWTSKTLFETTHIVEVPNNGRFKGANATKVVVTVRTEWHRGFLENGGEGVEVWDEVGGELQDITREIEQTFPFFSEDLQRDTTFPAEGESNESTSTRTGKRTLPFAFLIPSTTRVTMSNPSMQPPVNRFALQNYPRTPPASLSANDCQHANIEWTVEAILRFEDDPPSEVLTPTLPTTLPDTLAASEPIASTSTLSTTAPAQADEIVESTDTNPDLPTFLAATHDITSPFSHVGFLATTPSILVQRILFPFEPNDNHAQDLYSQWRPIVTGRWASVVAKHNGIPLEEISMEDKPVNPGQIVPCFGRDPRDESLGGTNMGNLRAMKGLLVEKEGGRAKWSTFEKRMIYQSKMGRKQGWVRSEVSIPSPSRLSRHASHLPILLNLSFVPSARLDVKGISRLKPIVIEQVIISLVLRSMSRGGKEERAHCTLDPIRTHEISLWDEVGFETIQSKGALKDPIGRKHLLLDPAGKGRDFKLMFNLQEDWISEESGVRSIPLRECGLSLRTPNVEREYILSVTIHCSKATRNTSFFSFRAPIQILAGDCEPSPEFSFGSSPPIIIGDLVAPPIYEEETVATVV